MNCPDCDHIDSFVTDSRANDTYIRRRRKCKRCGYTWTTNEILADDAKILRESRLGNMMDFETASRRRAKEMIIETLNKL